MVFSNKYKYYDKYNNNNIFNEKFFSKILSEYFNTYLEIYNNGSQLIGLSCLHILVCIRFILCV